jgi:hypothetical protein
MNLLSIVGPRLDNIYRIRRNCYYSSVSFSCKVNKAPVALGGGAPDLTMCRTAAALRVQHASSPSFAALAWSPRLLRLLVSLDRFRYCLDGVRVGVKFL